jgi:hypothetical protein
MLKDIFCPQCSFAFSPAGRGDVGGLPPTGGDYEWSETAYKKECPECKTVFEVTLRTSLDTGAIIRTVYQPKPFNENIVWYVFCTYSKNYFGENKGHISVISLHKDRESAENAFRNYANKESWENYYVLELRKDGYFLDGVHLKEGYSPAYISYKNIW